MSNELAMQGLTQSEPALLSETEIQLLPPNPLLSSDQLTPWSLHALEWLGFVPSVLLKLSKRIAAYVEKNSAQALVIFLSGSAPLLSHAKLLPYDDKSLDNFTTSPAVDREQLRNFIAELNNKINFEKDKERSITSRIKRRKRALESSSEVPTVQQEPAARHNRRRNNTSEIYVNAAGDRDLIRNATEKVENTAFDGNFSSEVEAVKDKLGEVKKQDYYREISQPWKNLFLDYDTKISFLEGNGAAIINARLAYESYKTNATLDITAITAKKALCSESVSQVITLTGSKEYALPTNYQEAFKNCEKQHGDLAKILNKITAFNSQLESEKSQKTFSATNSELLSLKTEVSSWYAAEKSTVEMFKYCSIKVKQLNTDIQYLIEKHASRDDKKVIEDCAKAFKAGNISEAIDRWKQFSRGENNSSCNIDWYHHGYEKKIVRLLYDDKTSSFYNILYFIYHFPCVDQRVEAYQTLFENLQKVDKENLERLDDMAKRLSHEKDDMSAEFKKKFESLKVNIQRHLKGYEAYNKAFNFLSKTTIESNNIKIPMSSYYNLSLTSGSFHDELKKSYKEAGELITQYKDFVFPSDGWMSHESDQVQLQLNMWVYDKWDKSIFGGAGAFFQFTTDDDGFVDPIGIFSEQGNGYITAFKHEFMHALLAGGIERYDFYRSIPRWFNDGLAELAQHGPCNKGQLGLLKRHMNAEHRCSRMTYQTFFNTSISMIDLNAQQQYEKYPNEWMLNYFLSYFNVLYLRMRHPEFLQQILHETHQRGWEGVDNASRSVRKKLSALFASEKDIFASWMANSTENHRFCFDSQANSQFKFSDNSALNSVSHFSILK